jgi:hypothetical protein
MSSFKSPRVLIYLLARSTICGLVLAATALDLPSPQHAWRKFELTS